MFKRLKGALSVVSLETNLRNIESFIHTETMQKQLLHFQYRI